MTAFTYPLSLLCADFNFSFFYLLYLQIEGSNLVISPVSNEDSGTYRCCAKNQAGEKKSSGAVLMVQGTLQIIQLPPNASTYPVAPIPSVHPCHPSPFSTQVIREYIYIGAFMLFCALPRWGSSSYYPRDILGDGANAIFVILFD